MLFEAPAQRAFASLVARITAERRCRKNEDRNDRRSGHIHQQMLAAESAGGCGGPQHAEQDHKSGRGDGPAQHRERERRQTEN